MIRVFKSAIISRQLDRGELDQLADDFKRYQKTGIPAADAHAQARNNSIMANLAGMAAKFREQF